VIFVDRGMLFGSGRYYRFNCVSKITNLNIKHFSDGKSLQIEEFVNSRYSCAIALEDLNSFIVTGGILNSTW
jgi:hypothetical protein